jgi:hypothetical protein
MSAGRELAELRWNQPEAVDWRVDRLALHIRSVVDRLPPLTADQRARLAAALRGTPGKP